MFTKKANRAESRKLHSCNIVGTQVVDRILEALMERTFVVRFIDAWMRSIGYVRMIYSPFFPQMRASSKGVNFHIFTWGSDPIVFQQRATGRIGRLR